MEKKIKKVEANNDDTNSIFIELSNGSIIVLELAKKLENPLFAEISSLAKPRTDGERVYWVNGASLTLDEIMEMLDCEEDV